jgi:hypothetical protein
MVEGAVPDCMNSRFLARQSIYFEFNAIIATVTVLLIHHIIFCHLLCELDVSIPFTDEETKA